ncbi:DotI/IcmL/TraM family protein [Pseudovibrio ascidiaceicola]|uniref:DotI/IcmL/TraM family protein n=1 Tax=Pseudovibrio ascidiaceicola TaxID=285279 RepID=UPI003D362ACE
MGIKVTKMGNEASDELDTAYVVATILRGRAYASKRLYYTIRLTLLLVFALILVIIANFLRWSNPPQFRYVFTNELGVIEELVGVTKPKHSDRVVADWTVDAVTRLFTFNYLDYREKLQASKPNLTPTGWRLFQDLLKDAKLLESVKKIGYSALAVPTGPAEVIKKGDVLGDHAWRIRFPMNLFLATAHPQDDPNYKEITLPLVLEVVVTRRPEYVHEMGLGIRSIVMAE